MQPRRWIVTRGLLSPMKKGGCSSHPVHRTHYFTTGTGHGGVDQRIIFAIRCRTCLPFPAWLCPSPKRWGQPGNPSPAPRCYLQAVFLLQSALITASITSFEFHLTLDRTLSVRSSVFTQSDLAKTLFVRELGRKLPGAFPRIQGGRRFIRMMQMQSVRQS